MLLCPWVPKEKQGGKEGEIPDCTHRTDSCGVGVGWGQLDKQDPEKLTSFSLDQHLNIAEGRKLWWPKRKIQLQDVSTYGPNYPHSHAYPNGGRT